MMTTRSLLAIAIGVSTAFAIPAHAQDNTVTLRIDQGSAMTSTGGEFASAPSGAALAPGHRVMLPEDSVATLIYSDNCTRTLDTAGVYTVAASCTPVAAAPGGTAATGVDWQGAGILLAGSVAIGAALASMDTVPAPPEYIPPPPPPVSR